jgi:chromosome segregation ATPase
VELPELVDKFGIAVAILIVVLPTVGVVARGWIEVSKIRATANAKLVEAQSGQEEAETNTRKLVDSLTLKFYEEARKADQRFNDQLKEYSNLKAENAKLAGLLEGSQASNTELIKHLQKSLDDAQASNRQLQEQILALNEDKAKKDARITQIEGDLKSLRGQLTASAQERVELDANNVRLAAEVSKLETEKQAKEKENEQLLAMIKELEERISSLESKNKTLQERIDHLEAAEADKHRETPLEPIAQALDAPQTQTVS